MGTGASSGIGFTRAKERTDRGFDVVICAEDEGIAQAAIELSARGTVVTAVRADLRTAEGVAQLHDAIGRTGMAVDARLLTAGVGVGGAFIDTQLEDDLDMLKAAQAARMSKIEPTSGCRMSRCTTSS